MIRRNHARKRINAETWLLIEAKIRQEWSPEQISGWLKRHVGIEISHEWIYQYVLADKHAGGRLYRHLHCQKKHRKRYSSYDRRGKLHNRVSIEERSAIVDERQRIGDWEVDTITVHEVLFITNCLNHRPRKCLDFRTPFEVFFEHSAALAS